MHTSPQILRPFGFRPSEISSLVNRGVVDIHAGEAAFLWMQRDRAVRSPQFALRHLARLDRRVQAHLQGLRVAGAAGTAAARGLLAECDAGAVFVNAYLAFSDADPARMRTTTQLGLSSPAFTRALTAALAWVDLKALRGPLDRLLRSPDPLHRCIAIGTLTAHRADSGEALALAAASEHRQLRARALRSIGELRRGDLSGPLREAANDPDTACRFWAARSRVLLGDASAAIPALEAARAAPALLKPAIDVAMRCGDPRAGRDAVRALALQAATRRLAVHATGALGDPASVPWLIALMDEPLLARAAGEAFSMITGADLAYLGLKQDAPDDAPQDEDPDDAGLPWPAPAALTDWWAAERARFAPGIRYLAGLPASAASALAVLKAGYQRQRHGAALELAHLGGSAMLFPVEARADWQSRRLAA
ncbi:TIGR02270 family protein [Sphaerotilaceae bacterium SBD11-9]